MGTGRRGADRRAMKLEERGSARKPRSPALDSRRGCPKMAARVVGQRRTPIPPPPRSPMRTLSSEDAAALLRLNVKRVQSLARDGKLPAVRVGRRWLFDQDQLETLLRGQAPRPGRGALDISARNRLRGTITRLRVDGIMAEVVLRIGEQELVSVITRASAERMHLQAGDEVFALVKSTEVMIGREAAGDPA